MRKGNLALDLMLMCFVLFGIVIVLIYAAKLNNDILTPLVATNATGAQGTAILQNQLSIYPSLWDNLGILIFGLIWVFLLVSSYYINTSPIFFIVMIVLMIGAFIVIMTLANAYDSLAENTDFATYAAVFPKLNWLMYHLVETVVVVLITCGIALYAKKDTGVYQ